ncbi:sensor histidine kinase [Erythrobacteraceae bacterium CFH 75059]|uniref:sensor histidine kinase n=1 Tax=Qipengyuania thermophila TaxID=2509361 RepID=UPI00101EBF3E|nr:histidine kinase [Qipengyuania thermophila]TCD06641.1 sensor histidine kinase [Erythrobacteraceae bacterium CFH 75059]
MVALPIKPVPFFENKNRAFWQLQFAGWTGAFVLRSASAIAGRQEWDFLIITLIEMVSGFSISLILAVIYRHLMQLRPILLWTGAVLALVVAVTVLTAIDAWVITLYRPESTTGFAQLFVGILIYPLTLLGAWSGLYFAINFFLKIEQQADRLLRLEAQAANAQLAMLRYQLNPHFLFNTLNSISTLVLLKQTDPANAMLTRLSAFLRHTLVAQPSAKHTVAQEVETLKLYLEIERMRFEERLRTSFRVSHEAADGLIPSLLLQPLVENAIKYAVSAQEEGARISIDAQRRGDRLRIEVSDTGPGPAAAGPLTAAELGHRARTSTGVGLVNIRNRLEQGYGEDHSFAIGRSEEGGFAVTIELPFETAPREPAPARPVAAQPA